MDLYQYLGTWLLYLGTLWGTQDRSREQALAPSTRSLARTRPPAERWPLRLRRGPQVDFVFGGELLEGSRGKCSTDFRGSVRDS